MGLRDKILGSSEAKAASKVADKELRDYSAGITDASDPTYQDLNAKANDAARKVPWIRR